MLDRLPIAIAALFMVAASAVGEEIKPDDPIRYELRQEGSGFVRLDKRTGAMSYCTADGRNLSCRVSAEEREAYENELALLRDRIAEIEKRLDGTEGAATNLKRQDRIAREPETKGPEPELQKRNQLEQTEQEFNRALDLATRAMRRFFDVIREMKLGLERS
jgi:hypothetical protein